MKHTSLILLATTVAIGSAHAQSPTRPPMHGMWMDTLDLTKTSGRTPRAGQALILGAKAHALLAGRFAVSPADILRVARPVLRHRVLPNFAAEAKGVSAEQIIDRLLEDVKPPKSEIKL